MDHAGVTLRAPEYGAPAVIPPEARENPYLGELVTSLVGARVASLRESGRHTLLQNNGFVGTARLGSAVVHLPARFPSFLERLLSFLAGTASRSLATAASQPGADGGTEDVAVIFMHNLLASLFQGLPFEYHAERRLGGPLHGRLLLGPTLRRFAARGIRHRAVLSTSRRQVDSSIASLLARAARLVVDNELVPVSQLGRLSLAASSLADRPDRTVASLAQGARESVARLNASTVLRQALSAAAALLSVEEEFAQIVPVPRAAAPARLWKVDQLWEYALFAVLRSAALPARIRAELHPLRSKPVTLLPDGGPAIDPDVVVFDGAAVAYVLDAKYSLASTPSADDVYQILAYVDRLSAKAGVLVYLSPSGDWEQMIGHSGHATLRGVGIAVQNPVPGLKRLAAFVGTECLDEFKLPLSV